MSAFTRRIVHDTLDVRAEYARLARLEAFHENVRKTPLELTVFRDRPNRMGATWPLYWKWPQGRIKMNLHVTHTRFDLMETIIHELAHADMNHRHPNERVGHGPKFWRKLDEAFAEAYPIAAKLLKPRVNRYHGRYAAALRAAALCEEAMGVMPTPPTILDGVARWEKITSNLPGAQVWMERPAATATAPEITPTGRVAKTQPSTAIVDGRVYEIVKAYPGLTRESIHEKYEDSYGDYPGKSAYNSLWRLRRDGRVVRTGHSWYSV